RATPQAFKSAEAFAHGSSAAGAASHAAIDEANAKMRRKLRISEASPREIGSDSRVERGDVEAGLDVHVRQVLLPELLHVIGGDATAKHPPLRGLDGTKAIVRPLRDVREGDEGQRHVVVRGRVWRSASGARGSDLRVELRRDDTEGARVAGPRLVV